MNMLRSFLALALAAGLAGCEGIGDGSTVDQLQIVPTSTDAADPSRLHLCLREQAIVVATFGDGAQADYSERARWSSSNPSVVSVSNGDVPLRLPSGPQFVDVPNTYYRSGTLTPHSPGTAVITATFSSLSASYQVTVDTATFKAAAASPGVDPQVQPPPRRYVGPQFTQAFRLLIVKQNGKTTFPSTLNPVVWRFTNGVTSSDGAASVVPDATNPNASLVSSFSTGIVTGLDPGPDVYEFRPSTSLCEDLTQPASVQVAPLAASSPLTLSHEDDFTGIGTTSRDLFGGSEELLKVVANLDTDGDGTGDQTQNVSSQVDYEVVHNTACASEDVANCACDSNGANCIKALLFNDRNRLFTLVADDAEDATITACFSTVDDDDHGNDCAETSPTLSNALPIHVVPVDYATAATTGTLTITPTSATQQVFTYPGVRFDAYATLNAVPPFTFYGGATQATQKITRYIGWTEYTGGSTTEAATGAYVRSLGDTFLQTPGSVEYLSDVTTNTTMDIYATPVAPFDTLGTTASPVTLTITP